MKGDGIVRVEDILRAVREILEDRLEKCLGNPNEGVLLTVGFVRDLIKVSEVDLSPDERVDLERVLGTKIF